MVEYTTVEQRIEQRIEERLFDEQVQYASNGISGRVMSRREFVQTMALGAAAFPFVPRAMRGFLNQLSQHMANPQQSSPQQYWGDTMYTPYAKVIPTIDGVGRKGEWEDDSSIYPLPVWNSPNVTGQIIASFMTKHTNDDWYLYVDYISYRKKSRDDTVMILLDTSDDGWEDRDSPDNFDITCKINDVNSSDLAVFSFGGDEIPYKDEIVARVGLDSSPRSESKHAQYEIKVPMRTLTKYSNYKKIIGFSLSVITDNPVGLGVAKLRIPLRDGNVDMVFKDEITTTTTALPPQVTSTTSQPPTTKTTSTSTSPPQNDNQDLVKLAEALEIGGVFGVATLGFLLYRYFKKKKASE